MLKHITICILIVVCCDARHFNIFKRDGSWPNCDTGYVACPVRERCIRENWLCDGDNDCGDLWDERPEICDETTCQTGYVKCNGSNKCIPESYLCDNDNDCGNYWDENHELCQKTCRPGYALCPGTGRCINQNFICDGDNDCGDNWDENPELCPDKTCPPGRVLCPGTGRCINQNFICDGDNDCGDNWDENPQTCGEIGTVRPTRPSIGWRDCMRQIGSTCSPLMSPLENRPGESSDEHKKRIVKQGFQQICSTVQPFTDCFITTRDIMCSPSALQSMPLDVAESFNVYPAVVQYACVEHQDAFVDLPRCALIDGGDDMMYSLQTQCFRNFNVDSNICEQANLIMSERRECVAGIIANYCSEELAQNIMTLVEEVLLHRGVCDSSNDTQRRAGVEGLVKLLGRAFN